jgi:tagatose 6-phosphate kinase
MRCLTITFNPAVDSTYWLGELVVGGTNRVRRLRRTAAGKGVNVARILRTLGHDVVATGYLGGGNGAFIESLLDTEGVEPRFVWLAEGESRACNTIIDEATGSTTEFLEPGPTVLASDLERFMERLEALLPGVEAVVIAGSVCGGITPDFIADVMRRVRVHSRRVFVDASGDTLRLMTAEGPDLVKPNEKEMEMLMDGPASFDEQVTFVRHELIGRQLPQDGVVLLSRGPGGAALIAQDYLLVAQAPSLRPVNTVGCGDALLAGFVGSWLAGEGDVASLRHAVACGSAAALCEVAGEIRLEDRDRFLSTVDIRTTDRAGLEHRLG